MKFCQPYHLFIPDEWKGWSYPEQPSLGPSYSESFFHGFVANLTHFRILLPSGPDYLMLTLAMFL